MKKIALDKIPQKKIRTLIKEQISSDIHLVTDLEPSYKNGDSTEAYFKHEKNFEIDQPINKVWDCFLEINPSKIWNRKLVSFGLMASKADGKIMYLGDPFDKAIPGQVYYINLKLLNGLIQLAVSNELIEINKKEKYILYSYTKGGKSEGLQRITFYDEGNQKTKLIHTTLYKSKSKFRDKYLYPYFHSKVIKEYHLGMRDYISKMLSVERSA